MRLVAIAALASMGCGSTDEGHGPSADGGMPSGGRGGASTSGGSGGDGGAAGAGAGSGGCAELEAARAVALQSARECIPNGDSAECGDDAAVPSDCGCPIAVNGSRPDLVTAAQDAYDAWRQSCEPPTRCQVIDCASDGPASSCVGSPGEAMCQW